MSADPSVPASSSQTGADFDRQGTVPLRQYVQALIDSAASRIEQQVKLVEGRLDQRIHDLDENFDDKLRASREPVVTLREHLTAQIEGISRTSLERLTVINGQIASLEKNCANARDMLAERLDGEVRQHRELSSARHSATAELAEARLRGAEALSANRLGDIDRRFNSQTELLSAAMQASEKAVLKAEMANEKRFESVNEFRAQLNDMIARLLPRGEADARIQSLSEKIDALQARVDRGEGSGNGLKQGWVILVGAIGMIGAILGILSFTSKVINPPSVVVERVQP